MKTCAICGAKFEVSHTCMTSAAGKKSAPLLDDLMDNMEDMTSTERCFIITAITARYCPECGEPYPENSRYRCNCLSNVENE